MKILLSEIKPKIKAFVFDFDGTIKSSKEPDCLPLELIERIVSAGKKVAIVTASGVSALNGLGQQITRLLLEGNYSTRVYLGIANGMGLYGLDKQGKCELYSYPIEIIDVKKILKAWEKAVSLVGIKDEDLVEKGLTTFKRFLEKDWGRYIPKDYLSLVKSRKGKCFAERLKVTLVMPRSEVFSQVEFVRMVQEEIDKLTGKEKFVIETGDDVFAHVTCWPRMEPKLFALNRIKLELELKDRELVVFGDMPFGNDRGMLIDSNLPYTFTNRYFKKKDVKKPPYFLSGLAERPVLSVYRAVNYLIN
ncbi:hypothetical protein KKE47_03510 [Patescibacteria group bacterium]|nr:hypothetical protein [Patescibacteria group bacterium]MCG2702542.1 hypothetical protein [Candidatus Parcubacteria bacterium]MBU4265108.1 hypothetical protein [Patescibacteria group bacterium]MBU4390672.1 hypothetical protein [Patescibacteria group bacterium]MBU4430763.1 hypothetical protein [Patescibacteria group bacterium]